MTQRIEVDFPVDMELSDDFQQQLMELLSKECAKYEQRYPSRVMWVGGVGDKILWREPEEPDFDDSILSFTVSERERYTDEDRQ